MATKITQNAPPTTPKVTTPARTAPRTSVPAKPAATIAKDAYGKTASVTPSYVTGGGAAPSSLSAPSLSGADAAGGAPSTDDTSSTDSSDTLAMDGDIETADDALKAFDTDCADPNNTAAKNMPDWMKDNVRQTLQDALNQLGSNPTPDQLHQAVLTAENQAVGQNIMFKAFISNLFQGMLDKMKGSQG